MINKVILIGNLGRDPEIRTTTSGQNVATLNLATSRKWTGKDGQRRDETEWHRVVVWGRQAEIAGQYLTKGRLIYVEGRIQTRSWDDRQTGEKKYTTEIVCDNFQMLGGRSDGGSHGASTPPPQDGPPSGPSGSGGGFGGGGSTGTGGGSQGPDDDDIPF